MATLPVINENKVTQHSFGIKLTRKNAKDGEILEYYKKYSDLYN